MQMIQAQQLLKLEMHCPGCGLPARLSIKSINRRVACPGCDVEFVATPGEDLKMDVRFLEWVCATTEKKFRLLYKRASPDEKYQLIKNSEARVQPATSETTRAPRGENFNVAEFERTDWSCPGCGSCGTLQSENCCHALFCDGLAVETAKGRYAACPRCGKSEYYTELMKEVPGTDNKNLPSPSMQLTPNTAARTGRELPAATKIAALPPALPPQLPPPQRKQLSSGGRKC